MAKGFNQIAGFDYSETFNPVAKPSTIRIILTLAVNMKWLVHQVDVNNAFLNGDLREEVYMYQPYCFQVSKKEHLVCRLKKALYGLRYAPRAWYIKIDRYLDEHGF